MKTTKNYRAHLREQALDCFHNTGSWKFGSGDTSSLFISLLDDIDTLEAKLKWYQSGDVHTCHEECARPMCVLHRKCVWQDDLLKRAKGIMGALDIANDLQWLVDYKKGPIAPAPRTE